MESEITVSDEPVTTKSSIQALFANKFLVMVAVLMFAAILITFIVVGLFAYAKFKDKKKPKKSEKKKKQESKCDHKSKQELQAETDKDLKEIEKMIAETDTEIKMDKEKNEKIELENRDVTLDAEVKLEESTSYSDDTSSDPAE